MMRPMSRYALGRVAAFDAAARRGIDGLQNRTRFYKWLSRAGNDVEVRTCAVKSRKDGSACVKEVVRASVDDPFVHLKDLAFVMISGYSVDWSPEKLGRKQDWSYKGEWDSGAYEPTKGLWKIGCKIVNPELLGRVRRFKWCAYNRTCGDVLDYLKVYAKFPKIEMLSKAGVGWFATKAGFVKQLTGDKEMMRFFSRNLDEIRKEQYGCDVVRMAYRRGCSLDEAWRRIADIRMFRGCRLPKGVDATRARQYLGGLKGVNEWRYADYLNGCVRLGMDLADTKVAFPKRFAAREKAVQAAVDALDRAERAELAAKMDGELAAVAQRMRRLETVKGAGLRVRLPKREADFVREGKLLGHCIGTGGYAAEVAKGKAVVAFVRRHSRPWEPYVTLRFSVASGEVTQCYGRKNSKPDEAVLKFVRGPVERVLKCESSKVLKLKSRESV